MRAMVQTPHRRATSMIASDHDRARTTSLQHPFTMIAA